MFDRYKKMLFPALLISAVSSMLLRASARARQARRSPNGEAYDAIDAFVEAQMRRLHIPGACIAIIKGKRIVHQRGFGAARPGGETPTPQTPFFIGSLTKSFTALAVMQLVEAGKVDLEAPVQRYLPWFHVTDPEVSSQMTVRHLLNQTSGMPMLPSEIIEDDFDDRPDATERQVRALSTLKISRPVGTRCEYSNFNYNILGLIIEAASSETYDEYIQKHIFKPLEMRHSYTTKAAAQQDGLAVGHRHWFSFPFPVPDRPVPRGSLPSGQLISSAEDMAHYLIAQLNGGVYKDKQILSSAGIDEMHRGVSELKMGELSGGFYGMGWFDIDLGAEKTYSHGGNVPDFSAYMALVPGQKKACILLFNADPYGLPIVTEELGMGVTAMLAGQQPEPIKLEFVQWVMRLLPLIPLIQLISAFSTLKKLGKWKRNPALRPAGACAWGKDILLPLIPNLSLAALLAYLHSSKMIRFLNLYMPDLALISNISGMFAGIWAVLRTGLVLRALHRHRV